MIGMLGSLFPGVPILALTATATPKKRKEIQSNLGMHNPVVIEANPNRPNIFLESKKQLGKGDDRLQAILEPLVEELKTKGLKFPLTLIYGDLSKISKCYSITCQLGHVQLLLTECSQCSMPNILNMSEIVL